MGDEAARLRRRRAAAAARPEAVEAADAGGEVGVLVSAEEGGEWGPTLEVGGREGGHDGVVGAVHPEGVRAELSPQRVVALCVVTSRDVRYVAW